MFGGTWVAWGAGRVPVGVDTTDTDFDTVEETGGTKSVTLTAAQEIAKAELEVMIESNKKSLEQQLRQNTQLSPEQKEKYKKLYDNMADSIKECYLEYLRLQGRLIL